MGFILTLFFFKKKSNIFTLMHMQLGFNNCTLPKKLSVFFIQSSLLDLN